MIPAKCLAEWEKTADYYLAWFHHSPLKGIFQDLACYDGISTWWVSSFNKRDVFEDNTWYVELNSLINGRTTHNQKSIKKSSLYFLLLKSFLSCILCRFASSGLPRLEAVSNVVAVSSYHYNFLYLDGKTTDKNFRELFSIIESVGQTPVCILYLTPTLKDYVRPLTYRQRIKSDVETFSFPVLIANRNETLLDCAKRFHWGRLTKKRIKDKLKELPEDNWKISDVNSKSVINRLLSSSFDGEIQDALKYGTVMSRTLSEIRPAVFLTYNELLSDSQHLYALLRRDLPKTKIITFQHSLINRNKLGFMYPVGSDFFSVPSSGPFPPDIYLVQGPRAKKLVANFFPVERINIIGSLKIDDHNLIPNIKAVDSATMKIVVTLSIGDEESILDLCVPLMRDSEDSWIIVFHPATQVARRKELIKRYAIDSFPFEVLSQLKDCDLIISGYSAVAVEGLLLGIPSVRILDCDVPPAIDSSDPFVRISSEVELAHAIERRRNGENIVENSNEVINSYFGTVDGKASSRLVTYLY